MSALPASSGSRWTVPLGGDPHRVPLTTLINIGPPSLRQIELDLAITAAIRAAGQRN